MRPATIRRQSSPGTTGKFLAWGYPLSNFLLAAAFLLALVSVITKMEGDWPLALLLVLALCSTLAGLARQLPAQNVLLAALVIAAAGSGAHIIGAASGIPFGPFLFGPAAGQELFKSLPWWMPLLWVVIVLNSRGVARLILRPWRKIRTYGLWLIGLTSLVTMLFDCALEPFAGHIKHYWIWTATHFSLTPRGAPLTSPLGWFFVTMLMLAFATPALINKQLSRRGLPNLHPFYVWLAAVLWFAVAAAAHDLWLEAGVDAIIIAVVTVFSIRGARW